MCDRHREQPFRLTTATGIPASMNVSGINDSVQLRYEIDKHHRRHRQHQQRQDKHHDADYGGHAEQGLQRGGPVAERSVMHGAVIPDFVAFYTRSAGQR